MPNCIKRTLSDLLVLGVVVTGSEHYADDAIELRIWLIWNAIPVKRRIKSDDTFPELSRSLALVLVCRPSLDC